MMAYAKVIDDECGMTDMNNPLDLLEGHLYYINVRVSLPKSVVGFRRVV